MPTARRLAPRPFGHGVALYVRPHSLLEVCSAEVCLRIRGLTQVNPPGYQRRVFNFLERKETHETS